MRLVIPGVEETQVVITTKLDEVGDVFVKANDVTLLMISNDGTVYTNAANKKELRGMGFNVTDKGDVQII